MSFFRNTIFALAAPFAFSGAALAAAQQVSVLSTKGCGCCTAWVKHLEENGYEAETKYLMMADLVQKKLKVGLKPALAACHTAMVGGYVIEGHVPAKEIKRLLSERPDAIGLAVPGMPYGSPGMGKPGPDSDTYDVLLVLRDGSTKVYASYP